MSGCTDKKCCYLQDLGSLAADVAERVCQAVHQRAEEEGQVGHYVQVWHAGKHLRQTGLSSASQFFQNMLGVMGFGLRPSTFCMMASLPIMQLR